MKHITEICNIPQLVKKDPTSLWDLSDRQFFSAGACHVLAYEHQKIYKDADYQIYLIKPQHARGTHVFTSNGQWCFDAFGYQSQNNFLNMYTECYQSIFGKNWDYHCIEIQESFEEFCQTYHHRDMNAFLKNPFPRACAYMKYFEIP